MPRRNGYDSDPYTSDTGDRSDREKRKPPPMANEDQITAANGNIEKRGRGRPPGEKNKKKQSEDDIKNNTKIEEYVGLFGKGGRVTRSPTNISQGVVRSAVQEEQRQEHATHASGASTGDGIVRTQGKATDQSKRGIAGEKSDMEEVMSMLHKLAADMQEMKRGYSGFKETLDKALAVSEECKEKMIQLEDENEEMKMRIQKLERNEEIREREYKKNNIIIRGIDTNVNAAENEIKAMLASKFGIKDNIKEIRPFIKGDKVLFSTVKFDNADVKRQLMSRKNKLAGTRISINHDFTFEQRDIQRKIRKIAKDSEEKGNEVKVGYKTLWENGIRYYWKDGQGLREDFREQRNRVPHDPAKGANTSQQSRDE